ncbi:MAG: smalltalk protein [Bacteroidaceae bacterium]|nr:smalltalk protein [Bacteroidaceae bacterium]
MNSKTQFNFGKLLKILIAVLTALAGSLGLASCAA